MISSVFIKNAVGTILMIHVKALPTKLLKSPVLPILTQPYNRRQEINQSLVIYQIYIKSFLFFTVHAHNFESNYNILWYFNLEYWFLECTLSGLANHFRPGCQTLPAWQARYSCPDHQSRDGARLSLLRSSLRDHRWAFSPGDPTRLARSSSCCSSVPGSASWGRWPEGGVDN